MKANISEIFKSIQGEGVYQGHQQVFVRFYGCNLRCRYCDTKLGSYEEKGIEQILDDISVYDNYHSVSLTGGEPLLQVAALRELAKALKERGKTVYLETNGTLPDELSKVIDWVDIISMDFKLSSSTGMVGYWDKHREFLKIASGKETFVKAVVGKNSQVGEIIESLKIIKETDPNITFIIQPENPYEEELGKKLLMLQSVCSLDSIKVEIKEQLHKKLNIR